MNERPGKALENTLDDRELSLPVFSPVCSFCRHLSVDRPQTCMAFPNGIPVEIWVGSNNHTRPFLGDHGIQFDLADDVPIAVATKRDLPLPGVQGSEPF